jgi:hypothetical protein
MVGLCSSNQPTISSVSGELKAFGKSMIPLELVNPCNLGDRCGIDFSVEI